MNKLLTIFCVFSILIAPAIAQKKPATPVPRPAPSPKGPPPYVLKKDYEPQMEELKAKINSVTNIAGAARKSVESKFRKVIMLDSQMIEVQNILSSASFQIAMNADSLKETRFSMEEFQKKTEANFSTMYEQEKVLSQKVWILFGMALAMCIAVLIILLVLLQKRMTAIQSLLFKNEEIAKKSVLLNSEKLQKELKNDLYLLESRMLVDNTTIKRELMLQLNKDREAAVETIKLLTEKIELLETQQTNSSSLDAEDPEMFI